VFDSTTVDAMAGGGVFRALAARNYNGACQACAAAIGGSRVSYNLPFLPNSGTLASVVILFLRRPAAALGKVKWFGATKRTALSSHLSDVLRNIEARRWFQDQMGE
jgi:hypothetical protein